jgi:septum site-determining protein MinD
MRVIGIVSSKGGVGKTTLTANLGVGLKHFDRNVVLVDGNLTNANLGLHFGISHAPLTLVDVLKKRKNILDAIHRHDSGVDIIPSPLDLDLTKVNPKKIKKVIKDLKNFYEILVIDSAPGVGTDTMSVIGLSDEILVITTPDPPSVFGCLKTINIARKLGREIGGIILNRVENKNYEVKRKDVESICGVNVVSIIPEDKNIQRSLIFQKPVVSYKPFSKSSKEFKRLSALLIGEQYRPSIFDRLKSIFSQK